MDRLPLCDQIPYEFIPPRLNRAWWRVSRVYNSLQILRRQQKVFAIDVEGVEHLEPLLDRGDGVLIAANHPDGAEPAVLFEVSHRVGRPFHYLAAHQLFRGTARFLLPRIGVFPIDREGSDLRAFRTGVEVLTKGQTPLVVFPEGEVYHTCDRLTPIREGAVSFATTAAKRLAESGKTAWIVPAAVKYRFLDGVDPLPAILRAMDRLEARFTWWPRSDRPIVERIYGYAEGLLGLKELELLGASRSGPLKERVASLRDAILDRIEDKRVGKRRTGAVPVRVKELRKVCVEALAGPGVAADRAADIRHDLNDLFVALQLFSYPGDYVKQDPTLERVAETVLKFEQDTMGAEEAKPLAPRRAIVRFGEPIDVGRRLADLGKPRVAVGPITEELQGRIQALLDAIGPGRPIGGAGVGSGTTTPPEPSPMAGSNDPVTSPVRP